jgi:hypothetical protein
MIVIKHLEFVNNETTLQLGRDSSLTLQTSSNGRGLPYDVTFRAFGKESFCKHFAAVQTALDENGKTKFQPDVLCGTSSGQHSFAAIIGLYKVVFVNPRDKSINEILSLYRKPSDDQGFYQLNLQPSKDGFLLIYEGGAARVSEDGYVVWHRQLAWDDIYRRTDDELIYYSSEFGEFAPDDWAISIADGSSVKLVEQ